jgi:hypothetical protein
MLAVIGSKADCGLVFVGLVLPVLVFKRQPPEMSTGGHMGMQSERVYCKHSEIYEPIVTVKM